MEYQFDRFRALCRAVSMIINLRFSQLTSISSALDNEILLTWLLEHGANPNIMSRRIKSCLQESTPLALAAQLSDTTALKILLSHGADMDPDAIFFAIGFGRQYNGTATLQMLIDHGADVNQISKRWGTPLSHAVWRQQEQHLKVLLENGADPAIQGSVTGASALVIAKRRGRMDFYKLMEEASIHSTP